MKNNIGTAFAVIDEYESRLSDIINELTDKIANCPDNPNIKRLSKNAFIINSSALTIKYKDDKGKTCIINNWSPEFHCFKWQYEKIIEIVKSQSPKKKKKGLRRVGSAVSSH